MAPTGHPGSGSPRARDKGRRSHVSKEGRLVRVRVLTKTGPRFYRVREARLATEYRPTYTMETKRKSSTGLRKGTRLFIPRRTVLEVMVYGLARKLEGDEYSFLPEQDWVFHFRPRTNPDRVTSIILERLSAHRIVIVDTEEGTYRPFTVATQVVDATDADLIRLADLPYVVDSKIADLSFHGRKK